MHAHAMCMRFVPQAGYAPKLRGGIEHLPGGWMAVTMEHLTLAAGWLPLYALLPSSGS